MIVHRISRCDPLFDHYITGKEGFKPLFGDRRDRAFQLRTREFCDKMVPLIKDVNGRNKIMEEKKLREVQVESENIFDGVILNVKRDQVRLPNGHKSVREVIRHVGAVCVVPVTEDGRVVVERQYRYPIDQVITEIPAGKLDSKQEDRLLGAQRELAEETGITADLWTDMGLYYPAPAYSDEKITMYLAQNLHMGKQHLDEDEFLNVELVPIMELVEDIMSGRITDGKTQVAILKAKLLLEKQEGLES